MWTSACRGNMPDMSTVHHFPQPQVLSPNDLRLAADAFEEALQLIPTEAHELKPYTARQLLARHVIDNALSGVRDPIRLRDGALDYLRIVAAKQIA